MFFRNSTRSASEIRNFHNVSLCEINYLLNKAEPVGWASDDSFRVEWVERHYADDALVATERWSAILTIVVQTPTNADRLKKNPLGVYVHALNWSKDLGRCAPCRSQPFCSPPLRLAPVRPGNHQRSLTMTHRGKRCCNPNRPSPCRSWSAKASAAARPAQAHSRRQDRSARRGGSACAR